MCPDAAALIIQHFWDHIFSDSGPNLPLSHIAPNVSAQKADVLASVRESYKGAVEFAFDSMRVPVSSNRNSLTEPQTRSTLFQLFMSRPF
jgi:hypothetical protein